MLLFLDGQGHYDTAGMATKYSAVSSVACTWSVAPEGRVGNCLKRVSTGPDANAGFLTLAPLTTRAGYWTPTTGGVFGCAVKIDDLSRVSDTTTKNLQSAFLQIVEGAFWHVGLHVNPSGTFTLIRYQSGTSGEDLLLAQSIEGLTSNAWMYVECKWLIHASAGSVEVRVNGGTVLTYTGPTRQSEGLADLGIWNAVHLGGVVAESPALPLTLRIGDLYLADLSGSGDDVRDFLGDGVIETIRPTGAGASTGWTPSGGANWDMVNDAVPDSDGTIVETTAPGTRDTYIYADVPSTALIKGVQVCLLARKLEEGTASLAPVIRQGTTDALGPAQGVASIAYDRYLTQAYDRNPATGAAFTAAEINAGQFGVEKVT